MQIHSPVFKEGEEIPVDYTCDGVDHSPPLAWTDIPEGTKSFALITDDPDAPAKTWVHWVIFNIPAGQTGVDENLLGNNMLPDGAVQGINSWGRNGYGGPCPPSGVHRYYFRLYALNKMLDLGPLAGKSEVLEAMQSHILAEAEIMGRYTRK